MSASWIFAGVMAALAAAAFAITARRSGRLAERRRTGEAVARVANARPPAPRRPPAARPDGAFHADGLAAALDKITKEAGHA